MDLTRYRENRDSIFLINIKLPSKYRDWLNEMMKYVTMLVTIHFLQYWTSSVNSVNQGLFNMKFWKVVLFTIIGLSMYYLVVKKIIRFRYIDEELPDNRELAIYATTFAPFGFFDRIREWLKSKL